VKQKMTKAELIAALESAERRIASLEQDAAPSQDTARFRSFVEHSNDGIILFDEQGNITIWNSTMEKMTGIPRAEIIGSSYWEMQHRLFTPQALSRIDLEKLKTDMLAVFATGRHYSLEKAVEFEIETPGGRRFVRLSSFSIKTEKGFCLGSIMHDITERKLAAEALREKEENLSAFFHTVDHFLFVTDGQGNILLSNEAVTRRLGYSAAELQGQNILMLHPPQRRAEAALIVRDILADKTDCCPIPLLAKDGREIPVETRIVKGRWSGRDAIFAVTKDMSEMMASEEKFSKVFQSSPAPMALTDLAGGKYVEVNEAFLALLGFTRDEVVGRTATELNLFADPAQRAALLGRMKEQGYLRDEDVLVRVKSGDLLQGVFAAEFVHLQEKTLLLTVMNDVTERRQVAQALHESDARWQFALEGAGDGVWDWNAQTNRVFFSCQWKQMLGYSDEEIGDSLDEWQSRVHPDDLENTLAEVNLHLSGQSPVYISEHRVLCKDGTYKWILDRGKVIEWTKDGKPLRVIGTHKDIDHHKQMEETLRKSEARLKGFLDSAPDAMVIVGSDGKIILANTQTETLFGYTASELLGMPVEAMIPEQVRERHLSHRASFVKTPKKFIAGIGNEVCALRKDGSEFFAEISISHHPVGDEMVVLCAIRDVTQRKKMENALRQSEGHYRALIETLDVSLCRWHPDTTLTFANEKYRRLFGVQGNVEGIKWLDFLPQETRASTAGFYEKLAEEPKTVSYEHPVVLEDGSQRHYHWIDSPIFDDSRKLVEFQSVGVDITDRRQVEKLVQAQRDLARVIATAASSSDAWSQCLEIAMRVSDMDSGGLYLFDENRQALELVHSQGLSAELVGEISRLAADSPSAQMVLRGEPMSFSEEELSPLVSHRREGLHLLVVIPIRYQNQVLGCLNISSHSSSNAVELARGILESIASEIGSVIIFIRTEEALRRSEALLSESQRIGRIGHVEWRSPRNSLICSDEIYDILDLPRNGAPITQDTIAGMMLPEDQDALRKLETQLFAQRKDPDYEYRILLEDGSERWMHQMGKITYGEDGFPTRMLAVIQDVTERKQAEEARRESEGKYRILAENISDVIWILDAATLRYRYVSPSILQLRGYNAEEVMAQEIYDGLTSEFARKLVEVWGPRIVEARQGVVKTYIDEIEQPCKNGGTVWTETITRFARNSENGALEVYGVSRNITERKRAAETLRESNETAQAIINAATESVFLMEIDGTILAANETTAARFGKKAADILGTNIYDLVPPRVAEARRKLIEPVFREGRPVQFEDERFGVWIENNVYPVADQDGQVRRIAVYARDMTERKRAEEVLQKSRKRVELALEGANAGMWDWNVQSGETVFNERWAEIVGYSLQELEPINIQTWANLCHPDDLKVSVGLLGKHFEGETEYYECEARMKHKNGSWVWVLDRGRVMEWDAEGKPLRMFGTHMDITERKREDRYTEARLKLANLSHQEVEMETLMQTILDEAEALTDSSIGFFHFVDKDQNTIALQSWSTNTLTSMCTAKGHGAHYPVNEAGIWADGIRSGEACIYNDYPGLPQRHELPQGHAPVTRLISLPIKRNHLVVAALGVGNKPIDYDEHDLQLVKRLAEEAFDIILRKRAEEDLRAGEEKYRGLLESLDSVISTVDYEGKLLFVNEVAASQLGSTVEELTAKLMNEVFPPQIADAQIEMVRTVIRADRSAVYESQSIVNGIPRWYRTSVQPIHDPSGRVSHALVNATDINDIKTAQQELQDLNRTLEERVRQRTAEVQDLYDNSPAGYHSLDKNGGILMINQTQLDWMGFAREEVVGRSVVDFLSPKSIDAFTEIFPVFIQQGAVRDLDFEFIRKDGTYFPVLINATAIYDSHGNYLMSRSTVFDNTERKAAEETMRRVNLELERALRMKDEFLANMSHELRTPLNAILGLSESLIEQVAGTLNDKQHKYLGTIHESGRHLLDLINDILDLAKVEAGQVALDISVVDVLAVCESSLRMIKQLAHKKNQTVQVEIEKEIGMARADERRLKQMIVNLLSNAVKFTPQGGSLGLTAKVDRYEGKLSITVWDRGIGISAADLERLFQPFVQVDSSLSRETSGTGLGLALVAQMARLHGGSIAVESQPQKGSRFTIVLPWQPAEALVGAPVQQAAGDFSPIDALENQGGMTILVVEDIENLVMLLGDYLEQNGFKVESAKNGFEGVALATRLKPDLILMDVMMPGMDGLEATRLIRQEESLQNVPIIAMTALAMSSDREHCLAAGMNDYISKPVNLKQLVRLIKIHLPDSSERKR